MFTLVLFACLTSGNFSGQCAYVSMSPTFDNIDTCNNKLLSILSSKDDSKIKVNKGVCVKTSDLDAAEGKINIRF